MRWKSALLMASMVATTQAGLVMNGWFDCSINTNSGGEDDASDSVTSSQDVDSSMMVAQCALIQVPLCHQDICRSNKTIELFVKRILSSTTSPKTVPDVWFIDGGPGASSIGQENTMQEMITARNGSVNVYTVDHRGTGRSNRFDCVAAQATTSGSPDGEQVTLQEFAACSADLAHQYGNDLSAFSITSAASDIAMLIKELKSEAGSFVCGFSYGTAVVERLIHLNVTGIAGYVLDGVSTSSGAAPAERFAYFSTWDLDFGLIGDRFLDLCKQDTFCNSKFGAKGPAETLKDLYIRMDSSAEATACTGLNEAFNRSEMVSNGSISSIVRNRLGKLLMGSSRAIIPALIYRMDRCSEEDKDVLQFVFNATAQSEQEAPDKDDSNLLYQLITFSDMWELPPPRQEELQKRFTDQLITTGNTADDLRLNCLYRMDKQSPACQELDLDWDALPNGTRPISYPRDKYWNVSAKVPEGASVLILNGKLDPQTHYRYAEYLYEAINAREDQKKLLLFEYFAHGTISETDELNDSPCGMKVVASYVENGGKLASLDTACMQHQAPIKFDLDAPESLGMGTSDAYDGTLVANTTRGHPLRQAVNIYRTLFFIFVVLFGIGALLVSILFCSLRKSRKQADTDQHYTQVTEQ